MSGFLQFSGGGGGGSPTGAAGGDLGSTYPNPTVVSISGTGGVATFKSAEILNNADGYTKFYTDVANVKTTDNTVTSIFTWTIPTDTTSQIDVIITAAQSASSHVTNSAAFKRSVMIKNNNGVVTVGTVHDNQSDKDVSTWDTTIDNSTTTGRIRVTGDNSTTIRWSCVTQRVETRIA